MKAILHQTKTLSATQQTERQARPSITTKIVSTYRSQTRSAGALQTGFSFSTQLSFFFCVCKYIECTERRQTKSYISHTFKKPGRYGFSVILQSENVGYIHVRMTEKNGTIV